MSNFYRDSTAFFGSALGLINAYLGCVGGFNQHHRARKADEG
jgi:hypothetical protein